MNRSGKVTIIVVLLLALSACAPPGSPPRTTVRLVSDKFAKGVTVNGIPNDNPDGDIDYMLQSLVDQRTGVVDHGIHVEWTYPGRSNGRYIAADDTARSLAVRVLDRDYCAFNSCDRTDKLDVQIDEATLRSRAASGFEVKLSAQDGSWAILDITPVMIRAQLEAEDKLLGGTPPQSNLALLRSNVPAEAPRYSVKDSGLGIGAIPLPGSKIKPGNYVDGLMVSSVQKGSPAEAAGIRIGDFMTSFDGHSLTDILAAPNIYHDAESRAIAKGQPGTVIPVEIVRNGQRMKLSIRL